MIPWPDLPENAPAGQRGAFFRWLNKLDTPEKFEIELRLATSEELQSKIFEIPTSVKSDVSFRRLQNFTVKPNETVAWSFGGASGSVQADKTGLVTIPQLTVTDHAEVLTLERR